MFAFLRGIVASKGAEGIALDVQGAGYAVMVPAGTQAQLVLHEEARLLTYCHIREDTFQIFGFLREEERALFIALLGITGVGPRVALAVLSALPPHTFQRAVLDNDVAAFNKVPGVGKKTAQRLVLEMRSKLGQDTELGALLGGEASAAVAAPEGDDVAEALLALGCTPQEARQAAAYARQQLGDEAGDEALVREALRSLARS